MFAKIAVPLDGSVLAEKALPYAIRLANICDAQLMLLRVAEVPGFVNDTVDSELAVVRESEFYLQEVTKIITDPNLDPCMLPEKVQPLVAYGNKTQEIVEIVPFEKADLIVMTTHGRTGFSRLLLGSVAAKILQKGSVPVLLIKPELVEPNVLPQDVLAEPITLTPGNLNMVVTLDGSPEAEAILQPAFELAHSLKATVHLVWVVVPFIPIEYGEMGVGYRYDPELETAEYVVQANKYLDKVILTNADKGITMIKEVLVGNATTEIMDYAKKVKADMLAMATHARSAIGQIFMGSVAEEVLNKTHLPVLLVHTTAKVASKSVAKETVAVN